MGNTQNFVNEKVPKLLISNKLSRYNGRCQDTETRSCLVTFFEEKINVVGIRIFLVPTLLAMTDWKGNKIFFRNETHYFTFIPVIHPTHMHVNISDLEKSFWKGRISG